MEDGYKKELVAAYSRVIEPNKRLWLRGSEKDMFEFICDKTLRFGHYKTWIHAKQFQTGDDTHGILGFPEWGLRNIELIRNRVKDRGFIFYEIDYSNPNRAVEYTVNVPALWEILHAKYCQFEGHREYLDILRRSLTDFKVAGYTDFRVQIHPEAEKALMKSREAIQVGVKQSEAGMQGKVERSKRKPPTPNTIQRIIRDYCKEFDLKYFEPAWTGKERQSVRTWAKYCKEQDQDPYEVLYEVCKYWSLFRLKITNDEGKLIRLPVAVSFWKFFQYRRQIGAWLATEKESAVESVGRWDNVETIRRKL
jgi:hypothetical protein